MPITKSAQKSLRVSLRRREENLRVKAALKKALRKTSRASLGETFSVLDKAVKTGVIHKNKAARLKSRLAKRLGSPGPAKKEVTRAKKPAARPKKKSSKE